MFARWLSNNQPNTPFDATLSGIRSLDAGIVAPACVLVVNTITAMGRTRLVSGNGSIGASANDLTIPGGFGRSVRGECAFAPAYPKQRQHQSHFRERCLCL